MLFYSFSIPLTPNELGLSSHTANWSFGYPQKGTVKQVDLSDGHRFVVNGQNGPALESRH